jgi:hypothetical protein
MLENSDLFHLKSHIRSFVTGQWARRRGGKKALVSQQPMYYKIISCLKDLQIYSLKNGFNYVNYRLQNNSVSCFFSY